MTRPRPRPRILLVSDYRGWTHEHAARSLAAVLADEYEFEIVCSVDAPDLTGRAVDLVVLLFWGDDLLRRYGVPRERLARLVASHRWTHPHYGALDDAAFVARYLADAGHVLCLSSRLVRQLAPHRPDARLFLYGIDVDQFTATPPRSGPVKIGWAGRISDDSKGVHDILLPAAGDSFELALADGSRAPAAMREFYGGLDVLCVASVAEGGSMPLIEGMACGLFPIAVDVGWVPDVIVHGRDGLIVERTPEAFRDAFAWCTAHPDEVRAAGAANAARIRETWGWSSLRDHLKSSFDAMLAATPPGPFTLEAA